MPFNARTPPKSVSISVKNIKMDGTSGQFLVQGELRNPRTVRWTFGMLSGWLGSGAPGQIVFNGWSGTQAVLAMLRPTSSDIAGGTVQMVPATGTDVYSGNTLTVWFEGD